MLSGMVLQWRRKHVDTDGERWALHCGTLLPGWEREPAAVSFRIVLQFNWSCDTDGSMCGWIRVHLWCDECDADGRSDGS